MVVSATPTKKLMLISSALVTILSLLDSSLDEVLTQRFRSASKRRNRLTFESVTRNLSDIEFRRAFRLWRRSFYKLVNILRRHLARNEHQAKRSSGSVISPCVRLAVTLRMMAGTSYIDQMMSFRLGRSTVYAIFHETVRAIVTEIKMPGVPLDDEQELKNIADSFHQSRSAPSPLYGCVGAVDGIAIAVTKPPDEYVPRNFYCRKGMYALPVQAVVDGNYRFLYMSCRCVGSTHDSVAFSVSYLAQRLREGALPSGYWLAGDAAYLCCDGMCTPWSLGALRHPEDGIFRDSFNFYHSSLRLHVEQAFGMLVRRWGILWRPLSYSMVDNLPIVSAAMRLHNFAIDNDGMALTFLTTFEEHVTDDAARQWLAECNDLLSQIGGGNQGARSDLTTSALRELMRKMLKEKGITRPPQS